MNELKKFLICFISIIFIVFSIVLVLDNNPPTNHAKEYMVNREFNGTHSIIYCNTNKASEFECAKLEAMIAMVKSIKEGCEKCSSQNHT